MFERLFIIDIIFEGTMEDNKNQPLIIEEKTDIPIYPQIQQAPVVVGVVQSNPYQQPPNQYYQGQPGQQGFQNQPRNYQGQPPYPQQPRNYQGQPYQGQPYQGQPYQGQPYQGQPQYQGQPPNFQGQYMAPQPPAQGGIPVQILNHPQIILIQQQMTQVCPSCGFTGSYTRRSAGCVTFSWCVCLFICTGIFCFWVPFCIDSCYDIQIVCSRCQFIKGIIQAKCA